MKNDSIFGYIGTGMSTGGAVYMGISGDVILSIAIGIVAILSGLVSIAYTIYKWYKNVTEVSSDGGKLITVDEVVAGVKEVAPMVEKLKEVVEDVKESV